VRHGLKASNLPLEDESYHSRGVGCEPIDKPSTGRRRPISKWLCKKTPPRPEPDQGSDQPEVAFAGSVYGTKGYHTATRVEHKLILMQARIANKSVIALIDSGATHNFVSSAFCERHGLVLGASSRVSHIRLANGKSQKSMGMLHDVRVHVGQSKVTQDLVAMPMRDEEFEVILGKPWLSEVNPHINWTSNEVRIGSSLVRGVYTPGHFEFKVCSLKSIKKVVSDKGARSWTVLIRVAKESQPTTKAKSNVATTRSDSPPSTSKPYSPSLDKPDWSPVREKLKTWPNLMQVLDDHKEIFEPLPDGAPVQKLVKHKIEIMPEKTPPYRPPYRMSPLELEELKKQIEGLLDKGWIRPSQSPYGSPVLFAAKPDGSLRLCIDYRGLNAITKKSRYPLPRVDETFDRMKKANFITRLDAPQAYHQVPIEPGDVEKTAFVTRYGQYEWIVMPFGLCNAPSTFQSLINRVLGSDMDECCMAYLDDIIIFSETREQHVKDVAKMLRKLRVANIHLRLSKCEFGVKETEFLGFIVGGGKLKPSESKIKVVREWVTPENVHDVRSFLGFCNFYRRFVHKYSEIAAPLNGLLRKDVKWEWREEHELAFKALKDALTSAPVLVLPDWSKPFYVVVDASKYAVGATLLQDQGKGLQPVAFDGRKMSEAELNYITTEHENLALVHALRNWRCYLEGRKFTVETDHSALQWLRTQPNLNRRQARWVELLASYDFDIVHKPGKQNVSDPLSRATHTPPLPEVYNMVTSEKDEDLLRKCREGYANDPYFANTRNLRRFEERDGLWYFEKRLCIPRDDTIIEEILKELHDAPSAGHFGYDKTLHAVSQRFFWADMKKDVRAYCRTCPVCQRTKHDNQLPAGLLQPIPVPDEPYEQVTMDFIFKLPLTPSHKNGCIVFVDRLTKRVAWEACHDSITAEGAARMFFNTIVRHHGVPKVITSDRDPRFTATFWSELQRLMGTKVKMSTADHAETDGQTEVANKMLLQLLRSYASDHPRTWDSDLVMAELAYNASMSTSTGVSPFYALYGRHPRMPIDLKIDSKNQAVQDLVTHVRSVWDTVKKNLKKAQDRQCRSANRRRRAVNYVVGDKVLVATKVFKLKLEGARKVMRVWQGPFEVLDVPSPVNVKVKMPRHLRTHNVLHVSKVKPWNETTRFGDRGAQPSYEMIDGDPEYEVETLLARKVVNGRVSYLVKWLGYDHCKNMWIRKEYLENAMDLVKEYDDAHPF